MSADNDTTKTPATPGEEVEGYLHGGSSSTKVEGLPQSFPLTSSRSDAAQGEADQGEADQGEAGQGEADDDESPSSRADRDARLAASRLEGAHRVTKDQRKSASRRSVLAGVAAVAVAGFGWNRLQSQAPNGNIPGFLRGGFEWNDQVWSTLFNEGGSAPEFDIAAARDLRLNGSVGLDPELDPGSWTLAVEGVDGDQIDEFSSDDVTFDAVAGVGTFDMVTEHKCIEGWANITHWTGARFSDVASRWEEQMARAEYVSLETPDGEYYVGLDMSSAMHPQTLLASGIGGEPLGADHGAPLRLVTPLHYGIKSLKRIGRIRFSIDRPADYWAERGYDWHSTH